MTKEKRRLLEKAYNWVFDNYPDKVNDLGFVEGVMIVLQREEEEDK